MGQSAPHCTDAGNSWPALGHAARAGFVSLPLAALVVVVSLMVRFDLPLAGSIAWVPALGIALDWRIDGLTALMLLMITGVGSAVFVYAGGYLAGHPGQRRLYVQLTLFMLAMIGCVTADNLFTLFLFWEATSVLSFLLVGFHHERAVSRKAAQQSLLVTGTGGLALLAGFILIAQVAGTSSISTVVQRLPAIAAEPLLAAGVLLVLVGAFTKSAQFPFHFWLPNAMAAPTPVSAYLHSATMVKLGVYLVARLDAGFDAWPLWQWLLQGAGSVTAAWGMVLALRERDLKRILAWSTVATLGTLVALVGLPGEGAAVAVGALLLAHALYKAPLFFVAGNVDHGVGTRVIDRLGGLRTALPWTAAAAALAGMSMAGIPLSFGFVAKDLIAAAKATDDVLALTAVANTVFSAVAVAVAGVAAVRVFWRKAPAPVPASVHEGGATLLLPPLVLAVLGIVLGLFPAWARPVLEGAGMAMTPGDDPVLAPVARVLLVESLTFASTFALGALVYLAWEPLHRVVDAVAMRLGTFGLAAQYERSLGWIPHIAAASTRWLQHGRSPAYMGVAAAVAVLAIGLPLVMAAPSLAWPAWSLPSLGAAGGVLLIAAGALAAAVLKERLVLLLGAGLVGYGSAVLFLFAGAPDVAFTQVVVETVFVIVIAAVLLALKRRGKATSVPEPGWRPLAFVLSLAFATVLTGLLLAAVAVPFDDSLSRWFGEHSVPAAQGRNVVNVILVDFRALDTLGEITVVMLSLLAAVTLLRAARHGRQPEIEP